MTEPTLHGILGRRDLPAALLAFTFASTTFVPLFWNGSTWADALAFSVPLMTILLSHELGHYIAARIHRVRASLPFFIPLPLPPLGTMGAVILMPDEIKNRNALLDIGAAGPLAGLAVALPILIYGIVTSPIEPLPTAAGTAYYVEGKSVLYLGLLYALKGPIPDGQDIMLSSTAFAGWAGLLVTMLNLIPSLQLDGGHIAHALLGDRHERISRWVRKALIPLGIGTALFYGGSAYLSGARGNALQSQIMVGAQWLLWGGILYWMAKGQDREHPATEGEPLTALRKVIAAFTLLLFVLLFMPVWLRTIIL